MGEPAENSAARYAQIMADVARAAKRARRDAADLCVLAVSKQFAAAAIEPILRGGHVDFGENRVQEAARKWPPLKQAFPAARLHLIGALQSNKAVQAVELFDAIHSLDRPKLAHALAAARTQTGHCPPLFIQVNLADEPQKSGCAPQDLGELIALARDTLGLPLHGLMCLPPRAHTAAPYFALLARLAAQYGLAGLSMGMSGDYPQAIQQGATHIRLGTAIFGARD